MVLRIVRTIRLEVLRRAARLEVRRMPAMLAATHRQAVMPVMRLTAMPLRRILKTSGAALAIYGQSYMAIRPVFRGISAVSTNQWSSGANRHFAAILLRDMTNRLHAETMPMLIVALGGAQIAFRILLQSGIVIILNPDNNKAILLV